ncbi:hypothetical protein HC928_26175 [bacterium]|nr:hypothetical protein [bacterium]
MPRCWSRSSGWWQRQQETTGLLPAQNLIWDLKRAIAALLLLLGSMLAVGGFLLLQPFTGWLSLLAASLGGVWLRRLSKERVYSSD